MYYGLKSQGWERYLWLDVQSLSQKLLRPDQTLVHTKYFTARISAPADKVKRQNTYIEAVQTLTDTSLYFGKYLTNPHTCRNCGYVHMAPSEKMTDVNIAVELLQDAFQDAFDTAILISADSDLIAPITAVKRLFPEKRVIVACPPNRFSVDLTKMPAGIFKSIAYQFRGASFLMRYAPPLASFCADLHRGSDLLGIAFGDAIV